MQSWTRSTVGRSRKLGCRSSSGWDTYVSVARPSIDRLARIWTYSKSFKSLSISLALPNRSGRCSLVSLRASRRFHLAISA
jgi:hypothetical protein